MGSQTCTWTPGAWVRRSDAEALTTTPPWGPRRGRLLLQDLTPITGNRGLDWMPLKGFPALESWNSGILVLWFAQEDRGKPCVEGKDISELLILKKNAKSDGLGTQPTEPPTRAHETSAGGRAQKGPPEAH